MNLRVSISDVFAGHIDRWTGRDFPFVSPSWLPNRSVFIISYDYYESRL